jgi:hypothetical protein
MERCVTDPETQLLFLEVEVTESSKSKSETNFENVKTKFQNSTDNAVNYLLGKYFFKGSLQNFQLSNCQAKTFF